MALDNAKNFAKATVSTGYDASATSIVLTTGHGAKFPTVPFNVVWWNSTDYPDPADDPNVEIVRVTARSSDTLTVTRAQESTSASTKNTAAKTYKMIAGLTAKAINTDITPAVTSGFSAYMSSNASNVSGTTLAFNTEHFDVGGVFDTATNTFTAPADGKYLVTFHVEFSSVVAGGSAIVSVRLNGTTDIIEVTERCASTDNQFAVVGSEIVQLSSGNTLIVRADSSDGTNTVVGANRKVSNFSVHQLS
jgi:hypothetical protein